MFATVKKFIKQFDWAQPWIKKYRRALLKWFFFKFRVKAYLANKQVVHFLHIGKTGGTSIKHAIQNRKSPFVNHKYVVFLHNHEFGLQDIWKGEKFFFVVRNPVKRFVSSFYSRKRKGMPRFFDDWTVEESKAFELFSTPNELALGLTSDDESVRTAARAAMKNIGHVRTSYWDWFVDEETLQTRLSDIVLVGQQETLSEDFKRLKGILDLPSSMQLPNDSVSTHSTPEKFDKRLEPEAVKNLTEWYEREYHLLQILADNNLISENW